MWELTSDRLFFAKARFYDPQIGRFISQDSFLGNVDTPPSLHRYVYGHNRPTYYIDPTGHAVVTGGRVEDVAEYDLDVLGGHDPTLPPAQLLETPEEAHAREQAKADKGRRAKLEKAAMGRLGRLGELAEGGFSHYAEITIEESDFTNGKLDSSKLRAALEQQVGRYAFQENPDLEARLAASAARAKAGDVFDISELFSQGYETSRSKAEAVARELGAGEGYKRLGAIWGQEGAAPREMVLDAKASLIGRGVDDVVTGLFGYAAVRGTWAAGRALLRAGLGSGSRSAAGHGVNLLKPKTIQPAPQGIRFGAPRGGGGTVADRAYAYRVTGGAERAMYVRGTEFEASNAGVLVDAKNAASRGARRSFYDVSVPDKFTTRIRIPKVIDQAQRQLSAARGMGFKGIRWPVADANVAARLQTLFAERGIPIEVVHVPR